MKYYEIGYLPYEKRKELTNKGLYCYGIRSGDFEKDPWTIEPKVIANNVGYIITNEAIELIDNFKDYDEFTSENEIVNSIDDLLRNNKDLFEFITKDEMKELIKSKERLVYAYTSEKNYLIRYQDIPDFIVYTNRELGQTMDWFIYDEKSTVPIIKTMGEFLDKCDPNVREDIIDRLIKLQTGEIPCKKIKVINEFDYILEQRKAKLKNKELGR